jgi:hypothetical protein
MAVGMASTPARASRANAGTYAGLFLVTLSTLMLEIALTRIFSVTMWYHFAFLAISVALFGMTFGALAVHLLPRRFGDAQVKRDLWVYSLLFGVAIAVCFVLQLFIPFTPSLTVGGITSVVLICVTISIPFVFSGVVVCLALTRFPERISRLYATDLIGAGLGCILLVVLFAWFDGPSLVILIGAVAALGALAFATESGSKRGIALAVMTALLLGGFATVNARLAADGHPVLHIVWTKGARDPHHDYERWNAFSRLTVDGDPTNPATDHLSLVIDSTAGTLMPRYNGNPADASFLRRQIASLAHHIRRNADVAVVGSGGGADILSALEFGQRSVTGVELNGDTIDIVNRVFGDFTGHLDRDPRVKIVNDEARSYLTRTTRRYDIIQISLIDTWAASGAGAYALSENSLYTTQAWNTFLDRLKPNGILSVTRFYRTTDVHGRAVKPLETYRTVALAAEVLTQRAVKNPRKNIMVYRVPTGYGVDLATVLVSRDPFSARDVATLRARAEQFGFSRVLTPEAATDATLARLTAVGGPDAAVDDIASDISPPTDDRPFFFQMANLRTLLHRDIWRDDYVTRPVLILGLLAVIVFGLATCCVALPLFVARRTRRTLQGPMFAFYAYFAAIGLGFLLIETAQLQRLSIFLGHPTYGLTVVLFSVLVFSGVGSMLTERFVRSTRKSSILPPLTLLVLVVIASGFTTPHVLRAMAGATTPARIATAVAILAPVALAMGMPFAIGMRVAAAAPETPTAFLWAINGAASVCGSVFGVVIALFFGISAAFWTGVLAYAVASVAMLAITARSPERPCVDMAEPEPEAAALARV